MLNQFELRLMAAVAKAEPVTFDPAEKAVLRADVLRRLLLGILPGEKKAKVAFPGHCLTIEGAMIEGRVELDDARNGEGGEIPALVFRRCTFDSGFSGNHGTFARLAFLDCRFDQPPRPETPSISLNGATIGSDFDISDSCAVSDDGAFWIEGRGALLDGMFVAARARLNGPVPRDKVPDTEYGRLALHLGQAHVTGDMILMPGFVAQGGMSIQNARVDGDIWARGSLFTTGEGSAFKASYARLAGYVSFGPDPREDDVPMRTKALGKMDFYGAEIGGSVELTGALVGWFQSSRFAQDANYLALSFYQAKIGGHLIMIAETAGEHGTPFEAYGFVSLDALEIGTFLSLDGAELNSVPGGGPSGMGGLSLNHARIGASMSWGPALGPSQTTGFLPTCDGSIAFRRISVAGDMVLDGLAIAGDFDGTGATIGGDLFLYINSANGVALDRATVVGNLDLSNFYFRQDNPELPTSLPPPTLSLADTTIRHGLYVAPQAPPTIQLIAKRTQALRCYPGHELCEALWRVRQGDVTSIGQTGHIMLDGEVAVSLNGSSASIHRFNRERLSLQDEGAAEDYLRTFCAYVWGIGGSFYVDLPSPDADEDAPKSVWRVDEGKFRAEVPMSYQGGHCVGTFTIPLDGAVVMEEEVPLAGKPRRPFRFRPPFIYGFPGGGEVWPQDPVLAAMTVETEKLENAERKLRPHVHLSSRLDGGTIILCDASCDTLDDDGGRAWGRRVTLRLDRFSYSRQVTRAESSGAWEKGRDIAESRKAWLDLQLPEAERHPGFFIRPANPDSYYPQPLAQQIAVLRNSGEEEAAIRLEKLKRDTEAWLAAVRRKPAGRWVAHLLNALNRTLFGHLLSPTRAFVTCLALIALGYAGFVTADARGMLSLDAAPVASVFANGEKGGPAAPLVPPGTAVTAPPCARAANPLLYAADVFIPLVDLRQEARCTIRNAPGWWSEPTLWEILKALYAICGWVVISLAIITFTNVARRQGGLAG